MSRSSAGSAYRSRPVLFSLRALPCVDGRTRARGAHERYELAIRHAGNVGEEVMQEDGAHVRLEVDAGQVEGERADSLRGGGADAGQRHERARVAREDAAMAFHDLARGCLERQCPRL